VYSHFESKERLFSIVLYESAKQVADQFIESVARAFSGGDPKSDLVALGVAFAARRVDNPDHFAMLDQIQAESPHFPQATIDAWYEIGAHRIETEIAARLEELAGGGLLRIEDPQQAMVHFMALAGAGLRSRRFGTTLPSTTQIRDSVVAGVEAFLNGYAHTTLR
jgi:AcrR family transcriptional regulator